MNAETANNGNPVNSNDDQNKEANAAVSVQDTVDNAALKPDDYDSDPMIVAMREAEKEIEAATGGNGSQDQAAQSNEGGDGQAAAADNANAGADKDVSPMIPKARLDEVLRQRDEANAALNYLKGVIDTQKSMITGQAGTSTAEADGNQNTDVNAGKDAVSDIETQIAAKEAEIIALAQKYEDGDISLVDMEKQRIDIERGIRSLGDQRVNALIEKGKTEAASAATGTITAARIETEALTIQQQHPYVDAIDQLPPAIRDGIWNQITIEASNKLAAQGINPNDGTPESKMALIREKAALTDIYGPQYTGKQLQKPGNQNPNNQNGKQPLSDKAQERLNKANVSNQQPPSLTGAGTPGSVSELTPDAIEKMSEDQIADLLKVNPAAVNRAVGW
jgi:hypothetical protein